MTKKTLELPKKSDTWIKFNEGERGVYRVQYDSESFDKLETAVKNYQLTPIDRLGVVRDAFNLSASGEFKTVNVLNLARYFSMETELPVWEELSAGLYGAAAVFKGEKFYPKLAEYFRNVYMQAFKRLGWLPGKGEAHNTALLRALVLSQLAGYEDNKVISHAKKLFKIAQKGKPVPVDVRGVVYAAVAANGGQKEFSVFVKMYKAAKNMHEEQDRIGRAMGHFKDKKILKQVLNFALGEDVRAQDSPSIFVQVARNYYGNQLAWNYLTKNWKKIERKYNSGGHLLEWFVAGFSSFTSRHSALEIEKFFKKNPTPSLRRAISQLLEKINANYAWKRRDSKNIASWLKKYTYFKKNG